MTVVTEQEYFQLLDEMNKLLESVPRMPDHIAKILYELQDEEFAEMDEFEDDYEDEEEVCS